MGEKQDRELPPQSKSLFNQCAAADVEFIIDGCFSAIAVLFYAVKAAYQHAITMAQRHDGTTLQLTAA
jgi:hypothetical protein